MQMDCLSFRRRLRKWSNSRKKGLFSIWSYHSCSQCFGCGTVPRCNSSSLQSCSPRNAKGLVILCHTCFEKKLGAEKFTITKTSLHECHFRVQADINFVIRGNTRKNGSGPINLVHSCATAQSIERRLLEAVPTVGQRIRSAKLSSTQSVQIANYSIGTNRDSAKHVSCIGYVLICINYVLICMVSISLAN